jgi:hypothetical protein
MSAVAMLAFAACSHPAPEPAPAPAPAPPAETPAPPAIAPTLTTGAASGSYRMNAHIQGSRRGSRSAQNGMFQLSGQPAAAMMMGGPGAQFGAVVALPGYTRAPRGRSGQVAAWWPIGGDSIVVQFATNDAQVQLRGALQGGRVQGEVWFLSLESGSTFQMGTFTAIKGR